MIASSRERSVKPVNRKSSPYIYMRTLFAVSIVISVFNCDDCMPILINMNAVKHDYHTISETGSNAIAMRKAKPSAGLIWNAIRGALRWTLRIIGIIMFIMGAYVFYNAAHEPIGGIIGGIVDLIRGI